MTLLHHGEEISGHETDSILRKLKNCFKDTYHGEWTGFYNQGFPVLSKSRRMMWHTQFRQTEKPHDDHWSKEVWKSKVPCYGCLHLKSMSATAKDS